MTGNQFYQIGDIPLGVGTPSSMATLTNFKDTIQYEDNMFRTGSPYEGYDHPVQTTMMHPISVIENQDQAAMNTNQTFGSHDENSL
jgi:hypothetical protein